MMKNGRLLALAGLVTISLIVSIVNVGMTTYGHSARPLSKDRKLSGKDKDEKVKTGPEVAERVKQLKESNRAVRKALKAFEANTPKNRNSPKIEDSWAIVSGVSSRAIARATSPQARMRKAAMNPQDSLSENGVEIIFVPVYSVFGEWQGVFICNVYDSAGNFLQQYVADVVLIQDPTNLIWRGLFEVSFEGGEAYLESDPELGMITDPTFELGTSTEQQLEENPGMMPGLISSVTPSHFQKVNYRSGNLAVPQWRGRPPGYPPSPGATKWVKCTVAWCAGTGGVGCGVLSLLSAGTAWGPCAVAACSGSAAACAVQVILR